MAEIAFTPASSQAQKCISPPAPPSSPDVSTAQPPSVALPQGLIWSAFADPLGSPGCEHLYLTEDQRQTLQAFRSRQPLGPAGGAGGFIPLVSTAKSHRVNYQPHLTVPLGEPETFFQVYHSDVYLCRSARPFHAAEPPSAGCRTAIFEFSDKSAAALDHLCCNSGHLIRSQFMLSYHEQQPTDGREVKRHLDCWLKRLRRLAPAAAYIWVLEFQKRLAPHFHIFLTVENDRELGTKLAKAWVDITNGSEMQLAFHAHSKNFMPWKMDSANYLLKQYCLKKEQKDVPEQYQNVGRFWGNSRSLHPQPEIVTVSEIAKQTESFTYQWNPASIAHFFSKCLRRYHEHLMNYDSNGHRRRLASGKTQSRKRSKLARSFDSNPLPGAYRIKKGAKILAQLIAYVKSNPPDQFSVRIIQQTEVPF